MRKYDKEGRPQLRHMKFVDGILMSIMSMHHDNSIGDKFYFDIGAHRKSSWLRKRV